MANWLIVKVFVSSTFRDMNAERDYLVRVVFPELRERLEKYRIHLVDIDLRWGITKEQSDNNRALEFCLHQIDECRPFFIGILGERYGWVPDSCPKTDSAQYGWVQLQTGKSITELEIVHGVLNNLHAPDHALFYFRDPIFIKTVPTSKRYIYLEGPTDVEKGLPPEIIEDRVKRRRTCLQQLKKRIKEFKHPIPLFENYPCSWDKNALDPSTRTPGRVVGLDVFGKHLCKHLEAAIYADEKVRAHLASVRNPINDPYGLREESDYHERFMESRLRIHIERKELKSLADYLDTNETSPYLLSGLPGLGKSTILAKLCIVYHEKHPQTKIIPHFIGASPQSTSLTFMLRRLCLEMRELIGKLEIKQENLTEESHCKEDYITIPDDSVKLQETFRELVRRIPETMRLIIIIDALNQLDDLSEAQEMSWLPQQLPPNVKILVSCISEEGSETKALQVLRRRGIPELTLGVLSDDDCRTIIQTVPTLAAKTLDDTQIALMLNNPNMRNPLFLLVALEELRGFGSYEKLNEKIKSYPTENGSIGLTALFTQIIERLCAEIDEQVVCPVLSLLAVSRMGLSEQELMQIFLHLKLDKQGEWRFCNTVGRKAKKTYWQKRHPSLFGDIQIMLRQLRPYLHYRGPLIDFYHRNLWKAIRQIYLPDQQKIQHWHHILSEYFQGLGFGERRMLSESVYHLLNENCIDGVEKLLTDIDYISSRAKAGMITGLLDDYQRVMQKWHLRPPVTNVQSLSEYTQQLLMHNHNPTLIPCPAAPSAVIIPPRNDPLNQQQKNRLEDNISKQRKKAYYSSMFKAMAERKSIDDSILSGMINELAEANSLEKSKNQYFPSQLQNEVTPVPHSFAAIERIYVWQLFANNYAELLAEGDIPAFQLAYNSVSDGPVADAMNKRLVMRADLKGSWLRMISRPPFVFPPECILQANSFYPINNVAITLNGKRAAYGDGIGRILLLDLDTGRRIREFLGHRGEITGLSISIDERFLVSSSRDGTLRQWDLETGFCIESVNCGTELYCSAISPDGFIAAAGALGSVIIFDFQMENRKQFPIYYRNGRMALVSTIAITPDGQRVMFYNPLSSMLESWRIADGERVFQLDDHKGYFSNFVITPDEKRAVLSYEDKICVCDLQSGKCISELEGSKVQVAITPDGKWVISGWGSSLEVWDISSATCIRQCEGHARNISSVAVAADGSRAISADGSGGLRVWDLHSPSWRPAKQNHFGIISNILIARHHGHAISTGRDDGIIRRWDVKTGKLIRATNPGDRSAIIYALLSPDERVYIIWGYYNLPEVRDSCTDQELISLWPAQSARLIVFFPDSAKIICCINNYLVSNRHLIRAIGIASGSHLIWESENLGGKEVEFNALVVAPKKPYALTGRADGVIQKWCMASGKCLGSWKGHQKAITKILLIHNGECALTASVDCTIQIWDTETDMCTGELNGCAYVVIDMVYINSKHQLLTAESNGNLRLWDLSSKKCLFTMKGHTGPVCKIIISPDERWAASAGIDDCRVRIWDLGLGTSIALHQMDSAICCFDAYDQTLVVGTFSGNVAMLHVEVPPSEVVR
jgi:WD40 repeat protein